MTAERLEFRRMSRDETAWVRKVVLAEAGMIWEVFRQEREGAAFQHGGSLEAPNRDVRECVREGVLRPARRVVRALGRSARRGHRGATIRTSPRCSTATTGAWTATRSR